MPRYHYPKLSTFDFGFIRSPGPGLGNLLFPIARALIQDVKEDGSIFIYPTVPQLKFGPIFRLENDTRMYLSVFKSRSFFEWKNFLRMWMIVDQINEEDYDSSRAMENESRVIKYQGLGDYFHDLEGFESYIKRWVKKNMIQPPSAFSSSKIVIHVRQGDFSPFSQDKIDTCYKTPYEWYVKALEFARSSIKINEPILLLTDGDCVDVATQLGLGPSEYRVPPTQYNALHTIMLGANAEMLVASKSTFSMWMRFFGESQVLWEPEFEISKYFTVTRRDQFLS